MVFNMVKKGISVLAVASLLSTAAMAKGVSAPAEAGMYKGFKESVAKKTGKTVEEIDREALEHARKAGKLNDAEIEAARKGTEFSAKKQAELVSFLSTSASFKAKVGLASVKAKSVKMEERLGKDMEALSEKTGAAKAEVKPVAKTEKATEAKAELKPVVAKTETKVTETVAKEAVSKQVEMRTENVRNAISAAAAEAVSSVPAEYTATMAKFGNILAKRVKNSQIDRAVAEQMIIDVANSPKQLDGMLVIGRGATEACMEMQAEAVTNLAEFINGGAKEGKDAETYMNGMARAAAEKFKQTLEEGKARMCAVGGSQCQLVNPVPFAKVCAGKGKVM